MPQKKQLFRDGPLSSSTLYILLVLRHRDFHGYDIMKQVEQLTEGAIKHLVEKRLITEVGSKIDPNLSQDRRRFYHLSGTGEQVLTAELDRLTNVLVIAREGL